MTEKRKPTYDLEAFKAAADSLGKLDVAESAMRDALGLGFDRRGMNDVIQSMQRRHFYKSMTSYRDYKAWQDVYHVPSKKGLLYIKFTADIMTEFRLLSFKEK